jgi:hypothetical protein
VKVDIGKTGASLRSIVTKQHIGISEFGYKRDELRCCRRECTAPNLPTAGIDPYEISRNVSSLQSSLSSTDIQVLIRSSCVHQNTLSPHLENYFTRTPCCTRGPHLLIPPNAQIRVARRKGEGQSKIER